MTNREQGIILKGVGGLYTVKITDERSERRGERVQCRARGAFRHNNITPLAGDRVLLHTDDENKKDHKAADSGLVIDEILERKNALIRPPLANLDYIFVTEHKNVAIDSFEIDTSDEAYASSDHFPLIARARIFAK